MTQRMVHYFLVATSTENGLQRSSSFLCGPERELHQHQRIIVRFSSALAITSLPELLLSEEG